jgi:hypothetical protein
MQLRPETMAITVIGIMAIAIIATMTTAARTGIGIAAR